MTAERPLVTQCAVCRELVLISWEIARPGLRLDCPHCGAPVLIWHLINSPPGGSREGRVHD